MRFNTDVGLAVEIINNQIDTLTKWGLRQETISTNGFRVTWCNVYGWSCGRQVYKKAISIELDANELFISGHTKATIEEALPLLKWHPLFWSSYEAQNNRGGIE